MPALAALGNQAPSIVSVGVEETLGNSLLARQLPPQQQTASSASASTRLASSTLPWSLTMHDWGTNAVGRGVGPETILLRVYFGAGDRAQVRRVLPESRDEARPVVPALEAALLSQTESSELLGVCLPPVIPQQVQEKWSLV